MMLLGGGELMVGSEWHWAGWLRSDASSAASEGDVQCDCENRWGRRSADPSHTPEVIYDMRNDSVLLSHICEASMSVGRLGLAIEHGIVGSPEWWEAVGTGCVEIQRFDGVIVRVDGGVNGDSTIVRIERGGEIKSWVAWAGFGSELIGRDEKNGDRYI